MGELKKKFTIHTTKNPKDEKSSEDFVVSGSEVKSGKLTSKMPQEFYSDTDQISKIKIITDEDEIHFDIQDGTESKSVQLSDIKDIMANNNNIQKVVIEQVSSSVAKRLSLLFDADDEVDGQYKNAVTAVSNPVEDRAAKIQKIEDRINNSFMNDLDHPYEVEAIEKERESKETLKNEPENQREQVLSLKTAIPLIANEDELNKKDPETPLTSSTSEDTEDTEPTASTAMAEAKSFNLRNSFAKSFVEESAEVCAANTPVPDSEEAEYKRGTLVRKKKKSKPNEYYYKAKNHKDLFKVGKSYYEDAKQGVKCFSFANISASEEQQKTIFGIAAFFNYHSDISITVVTESFQNSAFRDLVQDPQVYAHHIEGQNEAIEMIDAGGFNILELHALEDFINRSTQDDSEEVIHQFISCSEVILWDLPSLEVLEKRKKIFFPITMELENASIIIQPEETEISDVDNLIDYFSKYNTPIKGIVVGKAKKSTKKTQKKRGWFR